MTPRQARVALGAFVVVAAGVTGNALYLQESPDRIAARPAAPPPPVRPEPQRQQGRGAESRAGKPSQHTADVPPAAPIRPAQPRTAQPKTAEPKTAEPKTAEPKTAEPKTAEPKTAEPKTAEPKTAEPKTAEPKTAEPKTAEPKTAADVAHAPRDAEPPKNAQALKVRTVRVAAIGDAPPVEAIASVDADTVRAVQTELNRRGYGPLTADGVMRAPARAAIMAFEQEHRLPLTGEASQELLKQMLFGEAPARGATGPPEIRSPQAMALVKDVQRQLAARGYQPGIADGRLSAETVAAIRSFEADQGLVPKGRISAVLLDKLENGMGGGGRHRDP